MKRFFHSFYGKLSAIFLVLLLLMGFVQILITMKASQEFHSEADQKLNLRLAKDVAAEFQPALQEGIDRSELEHMIHYMMVMNPKIEVYLLDSTGSILAFFAEPHKKVQMTSVDLEPVHHFLNQNFEMLILGDDPRHESRRKPFSAAPVAIDDRKGYVYIIIESEQFDSAAQTVWGGFLTETVVKGVLVSVLCTGMIGLILFALLTRRLGRMNAVVREFQQGDFKRRVEVPSQDEIGQLADSFNAMADTIEANLAELKRTDQLRRELIANVSHDLRSPLTSIKGYLETIQIKDDRLSPSERQEYIDVILGVTSMLSGLVEQLFELSKLDAMQVQPRPEPFSIADLIQDVVMKFKPAAESAGIRLKARVPGQLPQVYADIGLIERAISNLIDNALRYTPRDGEVTIEVAQTPEKIQVLVSDTGVGIEDKELPLIFDRFYRVEKSRARATGGSGLGLAIAKKILEIHHSAIEVESKRNVGTTFSFHLEPWQPSFALPN